MGFSAFFGKEDLMLGEVLEWLKRHAWKVCKRQKRFAGSNPALSAPQMAGAGSL